MVNNDRLVFNHFTDLVYEVEEYARKGFKEGMVFHDAIFKGNVSVFVTPYFMVHDVVEISTLLVCHSGGWKVTYTPLKGLELQGITTEDFLLVTHP